MTFQRYPLWVDVDGPGHPQSPGRVLVNNEDEEREALASGRGPAADNPPPDPGQKSLDEMGRDDLKQVLLHEGIPDSMSDDDIRAAIKLGRERRAEYAREEEEERQRDAEAREAGGDHGDGLQTDQQQSDPSEADKDAAGDKIAPDPADEANKTAGDTETRDAPASKSAPDVDARPEDAKKKVADDKPAGQVTEAADTPTEHKRGTRRRTSTEG